MLEVVQVQVTQHLVYYHKPLVDKVVVVTEFLQKNIQLDTLGMYIKFTVNQTLAVAEEDLQKTKD